MRKNKIQKIVLHIVPHDLPSLYDKINAFHVEIIERRLNQSTLIIDQKITVIDLINENLKSREINGIIH